MPGERSAESRQPVSWLHAANFPVNFSHDRRRRVVGHRPPQRPIPMQHRERRPRQRRPNLCAPPQRLAFPLQRNRQLLQSRRTRQPKSHRPRLRRWRRDDGPPIQHHRRERSPAPRQRKLNLRRLARFDSILNPMIPRPVRQLFGGCIALPRDRARLLNRRGRRRRRAAVAGRRNERGRRRDGAARIVAQSQAGDCRQLARRCLRRQRHCRRGAARIDGHLFRVAAEDRPRLPSRGVGQRQQIHRRVGRRRAPPRRAQAKGRRPRLRQSHAKFYRCDHRRRARCRSHRWRLTARQRREAIDHHGGTVRQFPGHVRRQLARGQHPQFAHAARRRPAQNFRPMFIPSRQRGDFNPRLAAKLHRRGRYGNQSARTRPIQINRQPQRRCA